MQRLEIIAANGEVETVTAIEDAELPAYLQAIERADGTRGVVMKADVTPITGASKAELAAMKARMTAVWEALPVEVRVVFRPLKTAVLDAINDNSFDEVQLLIVSAQVPPEFESAKTALLALCS